MAPRKKKSSKPETTVTDLEHHQLLADITRIINAWAKHAPDQKFAGISLEEFKKSVQPSFDVDAQIARLEWDLARLKKELDDEFQPVKGN